MRELTKDQKKQFIILGIILIVVMVVPIILSLFNTNTTENIIAENSEEEQNVDIETQDTYEAKVELAEVTIKNRYNAVKEITEGYIDKSKNANKIALCNILEPSYVSDNNITEDNVLEYTLQLNNTGDSTVTIDKMYQKEKSSRMTVYFVYGDVSVGAEKQDFMLMALIDSANETYYLYPERYMKDKGYDSVDKISSYEIALDEIQSNGYNTFKFKNV